MEFCVSDGSQLQRTAWRVGLIAGLVVIGFVSCRTMPSGGERPIVAVSVPPLAYLVDRVSGGLVETVVMVPPGANPATHEPTFAQLRAAERAALYVAVGHPQFPFERTWLDRLVTSPSRTVITMPSGSEQIRDPHVWLSPDLFSQTVDLVAAAMSDILPSQRGAFEANAQVLREDIARADGRATAMLAPYRGRIFLVFHASWSRLASAYHIRERVIEQDGREPSAAALADVIARSRREGIEVVFAQPQFSSSSAELVAKEIGARVESLNPLGYDWIAMIDSTATALQRAFRP